MQHLFRHSGPILAKYLPKDPSYRRVEERQYLSERLTESMPLVWAVEELLEVEYWVEW